MNPLTADLEIPAVEPEPTDAELDMIRREREARQPSTLDMLNASHKDFDLDDYKGCWFKTRRDI